jgi:hypothetical protein
MGNSILTLQILADFLLPLITAGVLIHVLLVLRRNGEAEPKVTLEAPAPTPVD